jgi:hypothetical protein
MKSLLLIMLLSAPFFPGRKNAGLTAGGISLLESYKKLLLQKSDCIKKIDTTVFYTITSSMPANEYGVYSSFTGNVSYASMYSGNYPDYIRNIWDWSDAAYSYYGACVPDPIIFPYSHDQPTSDDVFLIKFIPVSALKAYSGKPVWDNLTNLAAVHLADIKCIEAYYLENSEGYINQQYPDQYNNKKSALGIVSDIRLKTNQLVHTYLITNDMQDAPLDHVLWKK